MALAALTFRSSTASMIATRCGALAGDFEKNSERPRASSTGITLRTLPSSTTRSSTNRSECARAMIWRLTGWSGLAPSTPLGRRLRRAQQAARGAIGEGRLARALRPGQQPGVVQPSSRPGRLEGFLRRLVAVSSKTSRGWRSSATDRQPILHGRPDPGLHLLDAADRVDHGAARRLGAGDRQEALAQPLVERLALDSNRISPRPDTKARSSPRSPAGRRFRVRSGIVSSRTCTSSSGDQAPDRCPRPRPGRRVVEWRSGRRPPRRPWPSAGRITRSTWSRRAAYISSVSVHRAPAVGLAPKHDWISRMISAPWEPPGSRFATTSRPAFSRRATRRLSWVDFPSPLAAFEGDELAVDHRPKLASSPRKSRPRKSRRASRPWRRRSRPPPPCRGRHSLGLVGGPGNSTR